MYVYIYVYTCICILTFFLIHTLYIHIYMYIHFPLAMFLLSDQVQQFEATFTITDPKSFQSIAARRFAGA